MSIFKTPGLPGAELPATQITAAPAADLLTVEQVERAVPPTLKSSVTQSLVDRVNTIVTDPLLLEQIRNNFISYVGVMKEGKFKMDDYLNAVAYVSYKLMGYNNQDSYMRTFPTRYATLTAKGTSSKDIAAYVSAYAKGKLVNLIMEQSLVPSWVLNQHLYQEAINTQAELMRTAFSEKVRSDAANSILTHLKKPEGKDFQIDLNVKESSGLNELNELLAKIAAGQVGQIKDGANVRDIAGSRLIDVTPNKDDEA